MDVDGKALPAPPERRPILSTKDVPIDGFCGWNYITYDKYGHESVYSATHRTEKEAKDDLIASLTRTQCCDWGPETGVLFYTPPSVKVNGKMFKMRGGKVVSVKKSAPKRSK
jgi:hypothetical protein